MKGMAWFQGQRIGRTAAGHRPWAHAGVLGLSITAAVLLLLVPPSAHAQANAAATTGSAAGGDSDPDMRDGLGRGTRALLSLQTGGAAAGPSVPMNGDSTSAAYKRYLETFTHPVPEFFQQRVRSDNSSGGS